MMNLSKRVLAGLPCELRAWSSRFPSILGCSLPALLLLAISSSARAQNVPTITQAQMKCTVRQNNQIVDIPCPTGSSGGSQSGNTSNQVDPFGIMRRRAEKKARKQAQQQQQQQQQDAVAPTPAPAVENNPQPAPEDFGSSVRAEQQAEAQRRQQAFDSLKPSALGGLKDTGDGSDVVDLRALKDPDHATVPLLRGPGKPAWAAPITDPKVAKLAKGIGAIVPPLPIPSNEVDLTWKQIYLNEDTLMKTADRLLAAWDMEGLVGESIDLPCKVIMIAGKTFIAGESGAALYLVKQDQTYDEALGYLKNPAQSQQFARLVQDVRKNRPLPANADPAMVSAARAIADPKLRNSGASIAWDSMMSREAVSAMVRKASIEIGTEVVSDKANDLLLDLTKHKAAFEELSAERGQAVKMLGLASTTPAQRRQLRIVVDHANQLLADMYKVEKVETTANGMAIGDAAEKITDALLGPEAKAPEGR